jgi:hypothetical protein
MDPRCASCRHGRSPASADYPMGPICEAGRLHSGITCPGIVCSSQIKTRSGYSACSGTARMHSHVRSGHCARPAGRQYRQRLDAHGPVMAIPLTSIDCPYDEPNKLREHGAEVRPRIDTFMYQRIGLTSYAAVAQIGAYFWLAMTAQCDRWLRSWRGTMFTQCGCRECRQRSPVSYLQPGGVEDAEACRDAES